MINVVSEEKYRNGEIIFKEGSAGDWVYVVQSGAVEIFKTVEGQKLILEVLRPGDVFGEVGFIAGLGRIATAQAVGETSLGVIDRDFLSREFNKLPQDFRLILVSLAHRIKKTTDRACELGSRKATRVATMMPVVFKHGDQVIKAYLGNLSTWGLFIRTDAPFAPGQRFSLKLDLPGLDQELKIRCEVIWSRQSGQDPQGRPAGMGVKFIDITDEDFDTLKRFLQQEGVAVEEGGAGGSAPEGHSP